MKPVFAEIITIGDEILYGQIVDTNSAFMGSELGKIGVRVKQISSIYDDAEAIVQAVEEAQTRADLIVITGGLGPTRDDITKKTLADYFKCGLELDQKSLEDVEELFKARGRELTEVNKQQAHLGIAVDPDVDRLCFVSEDGSIFGEEYTLVAVADYVLQHRKGNTVSNMSSTRALKDITIKSGGEYFPSPVGEVNVVHKMKEVNAVIGGEGNGGIIVPDLHYGRDALIGIALFLTHLAQSKKSTTQLRRQYPDYFISKNKIELDNGIDVKKIFGNIQKKYKNYPINTEDGLKIEFDNDWVHLRTSNTEPIIRIYAESNFETTAGNIAKRIMQDIRESI